MYRSFRSPFAALFIGTLAFANARAQAVPEPQVDANTDNELSSSEQENRMASDFDALDANQDNFVSADEFAAARKADGAQSGEGDAMSGIESLDLDKDGRLSEGEYAAGEKAAFKQADANNDGNLDADERKAAEAMPAGMTAPQPTPEPTTAPATTP